jgi:hypothetical protein
MFIESSVNKTWQDRRRCGVAQDWIVWAGVYITL